MKKSDLIKIIARDAEIAYKDADLFLNTFVNVVMKTVASGEEVRVFGMGTWLKRTSKPRKYSDPRTGIGMITRERKKVQFRVAKALRELAKTNDEV